jgi:nitrogenase molybdenum-iron protein alpha/beta subunit
MVKATKKNDKWIKETDVKKGTLHKALDIDENKNIPKTLVDKIVKTEIGETITNPTSTGKKNIKVTKEIKAKANFAKNVRK